MRRPTCHRDESRRLDVKMTPMIDVIFLLLIFFVCTASFQAPEAILPTRLSMPGAIGTEFVPPDDVVDLDQIVVEVMRRDGSTRWRINDVDYMALAEVQAVLDAVKRVKADLPVILDVEPGVPMESVIDVYDLCRRLGLQQVQFAASITT